MKYYTLPDGEVISLADVIRVGRPQIDRKCFWKHPIRHLLKGHECHYFELEVRPHRKIRIYSDKEMMRFRILLQFIMEEDRQEILS
ncbi:MAG: hypothetical protein K8R90_03190 [Candidatus Cloacimonetes bacterium]|nr:hypothetical protein [Candidatus Cloacimonadota bacterium]